MYYLVVDLPNNNFKYGPFQTELEAEVYGLTMPERECDYLAYHVVTTEEIKKYPVYKTLRIKSVFRQ